MLICVDCKILNAVPTKTEPKSPRGFLPRPLLRADKMQKQNDSQGFAKFFPPENSFGKTKSALKPHHTARILEGQNPKKKKVLSILGKIHLRENQKSKRHFSFWVAERSEAVKTYWILGSKMNWRFCVLGKENFLIIEI